MNRNSQFPDFPDFRLLQLSDKTIFEKYIKKILPYSDFNFVSLWSYNTEEDIKVSLLNNNLVLLIRDYISNDITITFLGKNEPTHTISKLFEYAKQQKLRPLLKLIPHFNISSHKSDLKKSFHILTDRDNYDYVLSVNSLATLTGSDFTNKRNKLSRFLSLYPSVCFKEIDLSDPNMHHKIEQVFKKWGQNRHPDDTEHEEKAIKRLLQDWNNFQLVCFGVYIDQNLEAFTMMELLPKKYAITHFTKADPKKIGIFEYLYHSSAKVLLSKGVLYLNREQDLGLEGLRSGKMSWRPIRFLKKYTIQSKIN